MKFKLKTDMFWTLNKGDIIEGYNLTTKKERIKGVIHTYPAGYRKVDGQLIPWVFPAAQFEIVKEEV